METKYAESSANDTAAPFSRYFRIASLAIAIMIAITASIIASPTAQAHDRISAIRSACGPSFIQLPGVQGQRLKNRAGVTQGWVYLAYSGKLQQYCVVSNKISYHGKSTPVLARLRVQYGDGSASRVVENWVNARHYASVRIASAGRPAACVAYWGDVRQKMRSGQASGGKWNFSGCTLNPPPPPPAPPTEPQPPNNPKIVMDCGYVTCSAYLSRGLTKWVERKINPVANAGTKIMAGAASMACGIAAIESGPGAIAAGTFCGVVAAVYGDAFVNTVRTASSRNECVRVRFVPPYVAIVGLYNDNSGYCKD